MAVSLIQYFKLTLGLISTLTSAFGLKSWVFLSVESYWQTSSFLGISGGRVMAHILALS